MNRCVIVRDEQINVKRSEIEKKDQVIAEMKVKIVASETKIDELLKKMKTLEERKNSDSLRVAKGTPDIAVVIEGTGNKTGTKPKMKTRLEPLTLPNTSPLMEEPFVKYFMLKVEEGKKRLKCPFQLETDLASQVGGPVESIRGGGRDSFLVAVCNRNQSDKIRNVTQLVGNRCEISEESFFNVTKGLVFVQNYNTTDLASFTEGINNSVVKELVEAKWVKARRDHPSLHDHL